MRTRHAIASSVLPVAVFALTGCLDADPEDALGVEAAEINNGVLVPVDVFEAVGSLGGCTATLITDTLVLTAAHCVCGNDPDPLPCATSKTFTMKNVRPVSNPSIRQDVPITASPVVHPDYMIGTHLANDVAVLRLQQNASQLALVQPIPISQSLPAQGSLVTLVGFGRTNGPMGDCTVSQPNKLMGTTEIDQVIIGAAPGDITLRINGPAVHSCPGDSGGPAIQNGQVVGVTSTSDSSKAVFAYREWIGLQSASPGGRVGVFDVSGPSPAIYAYNDGLPDLTGLLGWVDANDVRVVGDFFGLGHDQVLYMNRGGSGGRLRIADYFDGFGPTDSLYWESWGQSALLNGWMDSNDAHVVGDFMHLGRDQLLLVNRTGSGNTGRVMVLDFATGSPVIRYFSTYNTDPWFNGWHDTSDGLLAGDFRGFGHDQLMFINRSGSGGRVLIADFSSGVAPGAWQYIEDYSQSVLLNGWHDAGDLLLAGDFRQLGYDQVMFINRGPGNGRVLVTDFSDGWQPAEWQYFESYGQSAILDTFHDTSDVVLAGDFRLLGYDQVAFVNRGPGSGRIQVLSFQDGWAPAEIQFSQSQNQPSSVLQRIEFNDIVLAGRVGQPDHAQLLTIEHLEQ